MDGRYFYRLRHADDIEAKSIYRRRAGNGEGVVIRGRMRNAGE